MTAFRLFLVVLLGCAGNAARGFLTGPSLTFVTINKARYRKDGLSNFGPSCSAHAGHEKNKSTPKNNVVGHGIGINNSPFRHGSRTTCLYDTSKNDNDTEETTTTTTTKKGDFWEEILNPFETKKIPAEMRDEIFRAEGNTPAAKERTKRVIIYTILTILLIGSAFFNGFLTEIRKPLSEDEMVKFMEAGYESVKPGDAPTLDDIGFGWVQSSFIFRFLFMNKIGGVLALVSGGVLGTLAELEFKSRQDNAEKIWEEIERRRSGKPKKKKITEAKKKKTRQGKQRKRLAALSEVIAEEGQEQTTTPTAIADKLSVSATDEQLPEMVDAEKEKEPKHASKEEEEVSGGGIFGKVKEFYQKADAMAASQALLLNKKLEDEGLIDKITDETGLKVIGKEEAEKLQQKRSQQESEEEEKTKQS